MRELPEDDIEAAEGTNVVHSHDRIASEDGTLVEHLQSLHHLDVDPGLSGSTQEGLHDRLHGETDAARD